MEHLSLKNQCKKTLTLQHYIFVLRDADTSIKVTDLPLMCTDMHFLHKLQRKYHIFVYVSSLLKHPAGTSNNSDKYESIQRF